MSYSITRKLLETEKPPEKIPDDFEGKCKIIERNTKIKFKDHSKNHERPDYTFAETPERAAELQRLEKIEFSKIKKLGLYKTDNEIAEEIKLLIKNNKISRDIEDTKNPSVRATTYQDIPLKWPFTHDEWLGYSQICLKLVDKLKRNQITPRWDLVKYRAENNFKAGIFHEFTSIWLITINQLPNDKIKQQSA